MVVPTKPLLTPIVRALTTDYHKTTPLIDQYEPEPSWLWRQWHHTVVPETWLTMVVVMSLATVGLIIFRGLGHVTWPPFAVPDKDHPAIARLHGLTIMWNYQLTLTTFVTSFFVSEAFKFWQRVVKDARKLQSMLGSLSLLAAVDAARDPSTGRVTPEAQRLLLEIARLQRLWHLLFWASQVRPAKGDELDGSLSELLTDEGMQQLVSRGAITAAEHASLVTLRSPKEFHCAVLSWLLSIILEGRRTELLIGPSSPHVSKLVDHCLNLRETSEIIPRELTTRMPLAYVHVVQVLVDTLLVLAPFALYPKMGVISILLSGMLVLFYRGFLALSKSFLDPLGNSDLTSIGQSLSVDVLISEANEDSLRWMAAAAAMPTSSGK